MVFARPSLPRGATAIDARPGWCVASWRNVMILHVSGEIDGAFLDAALAGHHAALTVDRGGYGVVMVAESTAKLPRMEVRGRATELRRQTQHLLRAQSMVLRGDGFFASAMRGVLTGIFTVAQSRVPMVVAGGDTEAADFVVRRACSADTETAALVEVMAALRRAVQVGSR